MYSNLSVVNAQTGEEGDSDLEMDTKLLYGNVFCETEEDRRKFEQKYGGEAGQKLGLLFPDEIVEIKWSKKKWPIKELLS